MKTCFFIACASLSFATMTCKGQVADAGPDTTLCVDSYTMQGSALPLGATGQWTIVSGCGTITNPDNPATTLNFLCIGINVFQWIVNDGGNITIDEMAITVYDPNMPFANAGMDQTIVGPQSSAQLSGSPTPIWPGTCSWNWVQGNGVVVDPNDPNSMVTGLIVGNNMLTWTCENGPCWSSPTVDTVVIQMMMVIAGLNDADQLGVPLLTFDPKIRQIQVQQRMSIDALEILDIHGRTLMSKSGGVRSVGLSGLPDGIYLARAILNDRVQVLRFVLGD